MTKFLALTLALCLHGSAVLRAQADDDQLVADVQMFTVLTAINMAGYDVGLGSPSDHPLRRVVREDLKDFQGSSLYRLKNLYEQFKLDDPAENLDQYVAFALLCGDAPTFELHARLPTDLPPEVRRIRTLSPILSEFYREAEIEKLWARYQGAYDNEIARYQEPLIQMLLETGSYLRFSPTSREMQTFKIHFSLMGAPNQVTSRSYGGVVRVVLQASKKLRMDEIRQSFLMHLLDRLSIRNAEEVAKKETLARLALFAPALSEAYKENFQLLLSKSLANAVEVRLTDVPGVEKQARVDQHLKEGFILTPYFFEKLPAFEAQAEPFPSYYKELVRELNVKHEVERLQGVEFVQAAPKTTSSPPIVPKVSKLDKLLNQAEGLFRLEQLEEARVKFEEALSEAGGKNGQAEYGLGRVAAFDGEPDLAREHFLRSIDSAEDTYLRAMSHIYIARIEDIVGNRDQALEHYQSALDVGDPSPQVKGLAEGGLKEPFGGGDDGEDEEDEEVEPPNDSR
ncbi:MAG: tetratricopeptide repeat protein [Acidobacteria bacterium]|nr:tetratricopeptide repeat protein [Acidobacteriota bacterium]